MKSPIATLVEFEKANEVNGGYKTSELVCEYIKLRLAAFSNEVFLGSEEKEGLFFAYFNVFN